MNKLIEFLASYGPQASSNNLYDEFVVGASERTGCRPINIEQPIVADVVALLLSDSVSSVILTGTAGDGKTYTARKVLEEIAGGEALWETTQKICEVSCLDNKNRKIRFIKDLSELKEEDKDEIFPDVCDALLGKSDVRYVICVNDGHLLKFFRDRGAPGSVLHDKIAMMLRGDVQTLPGFSINLINMSRLSHQDVFERVVDAVVEHPNWRDCEGCPCFGEQESPCPIRKNREILENKELDSMRQRLKELIAMAAADGKHLSVRQLILLVVNIILGDQKAGNELLTCARAKNRVAKGEYDLTNPYGNALGENLAERQRKQYGAFAILGDFGIGEETNNYFDNSLIDSPSRLPGDSVYGERIFSPQRSMYTKNSSLYASNFKHALIQQRRRLFFSLNPYAAEVLNENKKNPWNLTAYKYGFKYIQFSQCLLLGNINASVETTKTVNRIAGDVIRGLNRIMTNEMTKTNSELWLTEPSGVFSGHGIPLLVAVAGRPQQSQTWIKFSKLKDDGKAPTLDFIPLNRVDLKVELHLKPTLMEYILSIADGRLSASFSEECKRDIRHFQLKAVAAIQEASTPCVPALRETRVIEGVLRSHPISVLTEEDSWS